jgi:fructosamine-3-kinase
MIPQEVRQWIMDQGCGEVVAEQALSGGSINDSRRLATSMGMTYFIKTNPGAPEDMFKQEALGLETLRVPGAPRVPTVYLTGRDFILLEDLQPNGRRPDFWVCFGRQFAALHGKTRKTWGFADDNYLGTTPQPNPQTADGYTFFAQQRLMHLGTRVHAARLLDKAELKRLEKLAAKLKDLIPEQPASLLHGDLWGGNALHDQSGNPALIDPAAYYGWAEADLALTALFGGFPPEFYDAYVETRPLEDGWRARFPIYNLYHLLNHLLLFGRGYYGQVMQVLTTYA